MFSLTRLAKVSYLLAFSLVVFLLLSAKPSQAQSQAQSHATTGYRGSPGPPPVTFLVPNVSVGGVGGGFGGGFAGFGGGVGGGFGGGSLSFQTVTINLGSFFPNGGRLIGMPPPTMNLPLNNFGPGATLFGFAGFPPFLGFPSFSDSTGAPWSLITSLGLFNIGGGMGIGGVGGLLGGFGVGGIGGVGVGGIGGFGVGGMGGFAGKGFGGFNGGKAL